jgi:hypothetical protein
MRRITFPRCRGKEFTLAYGNAQQSHSPLRLSAWTESEFRESVSTSFRRAWAFILYIYKSYKDTPREKILEWFAKSPDIEALAKRKR